MRVRFIDGLAGSGERGVFYAKGTVADVDDRLAAGLIEKGAAVQVAEETDVYRALGETTMLRGAPENAVAVPRPAGMSDEQLAGLGFKTPAPKKGRR